MKRCILLVVFIFLVVPNGTKLSGQNNTQKDEEVFIYRDSDYTENHGKWTNFMPDKDAGKHLLISLVDKTDPYRGSTCARLEVKTWHPDGWLGLAATCKEDYWGDKPFDGAFALSGMRKVVFYARGQQGGESIQVKLLTTAGDSRFPYGDSAKGPIESEWITLGKTWKRYEIDVRSADLKRVVIPFSVFTDVSHNEAPGIVFYLDHIHYTKADQ